MLLAHRVAQCYSAPRSRTFTAGRSGVPAAFFRTAKSPVLAPDPAPAPAAPPVHVTSLAKLRNKRPASLKKPFIFEHKPHPHQKKIEIPVILANGKESIYVPPPLPQKAIGKRFLKRLKHRRVQRDKSHRQRLEQSSY